MKNKNEEYRKIFAKISAYKQKATIGITSTDPISSSDISLNLSKVMAENKNVLYIDLDNDNSNDPKFSNYNKLVRKEENFYLDNKLYRLNFTESDDLGLILSTEEFEKILVDAKKDFDYIIINEKSIESSQAYASSKIEDAKILVVNENRTDKKAFNNAREDFLKLGFEFLGVIYNK